MNKHIKEMIDDSYNDIKEFINRGEYNRILNYLQDKYKDDTYIENDFLIIAVFTCLSENLGKEFDDVLYNNIWDLYQS